jgi:hypothetical protein
MRKARTASQARAHAQPDIGSCVAIEQFGLLRSAVRLNLHRCARLCLARNWSLILGGARRTATPVNDLELMLRLAQAKVEVVELPARTYETESEFDPFAIDLKHAWPCEECVFYF